VILQQLKQVNCNCCAKFYTKTGLTAIPRISLTASEGRREWNAAPWLEVAGAGLAGGRPVHGVLGQPRRGAFAEPGAAKFASRGPNVALK